MYGVRLKVWGEYACFTRPEMKVERVSYEVMTPSAARGILEAILWKPAIRWVVDRIRVLKPIIFDSVRRNEVAHKMSVANVRKAMKGGPTPSLFVEDCRQQRAALVLRNVAYVIEAHFELTKRAGPDDNEAKFADMFTRRASKGQCFHRPYLGCREFPAQFELLEGDPPPSASELAGERDLGLMLLDLDFGRDMQPHFFPARMTDGVLNAPRPGWLEVGA
jgi:CRISPR-associated protein Cas5d